MLEEPLMREGPSAQEVEELSAPANITRRRIAVSTLGQGKSVAIQILFVFLSFIWVLLQAGIIHADASQWVYLGPPAGALYPLAIDIYDPSIIFSTDWKNVYKSTNKAKSWKLVSPGFPTDSNITVMAIDPQNSLILYVGTSNQGLFKSTDGGESWNPASNSFPTNQLGINYAVNSLAIDPSHPSTIYMGASGVYKSEDAGATWKPVNNGLSLQYTGLLEVRVLGINPHTPTTLYLGTEYNGIYKSLDGGGSWAPMNKGLENLYIEALAVDPINPNTICVGTLFAGAFKSTDGGENWTPINTGLPRSPTENWIEVSTLAFDPKRTTTIYAEIGIFEGSYYKSDFYKSDDGGLNWKQIVSGLTGVSTGSLSLGPVIIDPQNPATICLGTNQGIYFTTDGGANWEPANNSPTGMPVSALAVDPHSSLNLYAGSINGSIFKSEDEGMHWQTAAGLSHYQVTTLVIPPDDPRTIYAGTDGEGLYKSTDGGRSWIPKTIVSLMNGEAFSINALALDPRDSSCIFAATWDGLYKSTDGGENWKQLNEGMHPGSHFYSLAIDPETSSNIFVGGLYDFAPGGPHGSYITVSIVYRSIDGGDHWSPNLVDHSVYTGSLPSDDAFRILAIANSSTIYAGTNSNYAGTSTGYRSSDGGESWDEITIAPVQKIAIDPQNSDTVYVGNSTGVFKSVDRGQNWRSMPLAQAVSGLTALVVDPNNSSRIYAGTYEGVFYTQGNECTFSLSSASGTYLSSGMVLDHVNLTCPGSCRWTAASNDPWLTILSGASGWGNGMVSFSVAANTAPSPRTGTLTLAGQPFTVIQEGLATAFSLNNVTPGSGPVTGGTAVTLNGGGFQVSASVRMGGVPARIRSLTSSQIVVETGAASSAGRCDVSVTNPGGQTIVLENGFTYTAVTGALTEEIFVPIVLSSGGMNNSYFTSEMTLTNRGAGNATLNFTYMAALGSGSGTASNMLPAGQQRIVPDAISYLRSLGVPIPSSGSQGGTLRVAFVGLASPTDGGVIVRTTTIVPEGRAGLAYAGIPTSMALTEPSYIVGLRQNQTDRSNVAVQHGGSAADGDLTLWLTVFSGSGGVGFSQVLPEVVLAPGGFAQVSGILHSNGLSLENGYVKVERTSGTAPYYAYGVINDQANSDGSFILPVLESAMAGKTRMTLPVVVETGAFSTELIVTNRSANRKTLSCRYVTDAVQSDNGAATFSIDIPPGEQLIWSDLVERLRGQSVADIGPKGPTFAGALAVTGSGGDLSGITMAARTSVPGGGGEYGVFYAAVPEGGSPIQEAWLYGLQQNAENRTNLALVNTGEVDNNPDTFTIDLFDGNTGQKVQTMDGIILGANRWHQINSVLALYAPSTLQGYARITRTAGANPFIAYAVINDGSAPGQRSGDGAFISSAP
jgi:photosystem II stability/assembly factor-like uncharacterized protein